MGNGAGVYATQYGSLTESDLLQFQDIERRCKRGFYVNHPAEFRQDIKDAIKRNRIDILEILLSSGCIAPDTYPLHIAATYGSVDSVELLVSAGFSAKSVDLHGRTPLHCAALCREVDSVACVDYLVYQYKKAISSRDKEGSTPLLIAAQRTNIPVVKKLLQHGADASAVDRRGRSSLTFAKEAQSEELIQLLESSSTKAKLLQEIDQKRIMEVWEKFFENAFLSLEAEAQAEPGLVCDYSRVDLVKKQNRSMERASSFDKHCISNSKLGPYEPFYSREESLEGGELSDHQFAWFDWTLCSNQGVVDGEEYYVINTRSYVTKWLSELVVEYSYAFRSKNRHDLQLDSFCYSQKVTKAVTDEWNDVHYPLTIQQLFEEGWIAFFDVECNECYWMQLATGRCEKYLPVGDDFDNVVNLGFELYENDTQWVRPNQYPATMAWVCVPVGECQNDVFVAEAKTDFERSAYSSKHTDFERHISELEYEYDDALSNNGYVWNEGSQEWVYQYPCEPPSCYFYNTFTARSVWAEPSGWRDIVSTEWNGWWLCREESTGIEYWWNPETDESQLL